MINNEISKMQNARDLKLYRFIIAMALVASIIIALIVGIATVDSYKAGATATNAFTDLLMPKHIEGTEGYANGIVFYREKNKDYDVDKDEPLKAFNYYTIQDGKKAYLEDGMYYPPQYYMKDSKVEPIAVYLGFYFEMLNNVQIFKNVLRVIVTIVSLGLGAGIIYIWYRVWSKKEDERREREREFNRNFSKQ